MKQNRIYNYNAGPSTLPLEVLEQAHLDMVNYKGCGMGILEISHRSSEFIEIIENCESNLREILHIPDTYTTLFLQGGASSQFFMVPMNVLSKKKKATYLNTGLWSRKAIVEAEQFCDITIGFSSEKSNFDHVPKNREFHLAEGSQYLYYTSNNTIYGTQFHEVPQAEAMLVCDMSSDILSRHVPIEKYGIIFAGAQKNLGTAGVTIVIIRTDLLECASRDIPTMLQYRTHADKKSMFNTPPTFSIYVMDKMLQWVKKEGGITEFEKRNREKAALIYNVIDNSSYYHGHAQTESRSFMNVSFTLRTPQLEAQFIAEARKNGFSGLKGHSSVGGCRASMYNAFPLEGVEKLVVFMEEFQQRNPV